MDVCMIIFYLLDYCRMCISMNEISPLSEERQQKFLNTTSTACYLTLHNINCMLTDITLREPVLQLSFSKCRSLWSYSLHTNTGSWGTKLGPHTLNFHPCITSRHILQRNKLSSVHKMYWSVHQLHGCVSVDDSLKSVLLHMRVCAHVCVSVCKS